MKNAKSTVPSGAKPKLPWYPLYPIDFDVDTMRWPLEAVGALIRLMNLQWRDGYLPANQEKLAREAGCLDSDQWREIWTGYLAEKFTQTAPGRLINNRLDRERNLQQKKGKQARAAAMKRWADATSSADASADALPQASESESESESEGTTNSPTVRVPCQAIVDLYHEHCPDLPRVKVISEKRKRSIRTRWKKFEFVRGVGTPGAAMELHKFNELDTWERYFKFITKHCSFMAGNNDRNWTANFDFCIRESGMINVLENKYVDRKQ